MPKQFRSNICYLDSFYRKSLNLVSKLIFQDTIFWFPAQNSWIAILWSHNNHKTIDFHKLSHIIYIVYLSINLRLLEGITNTLSQSIYSYQPLTTSINTGNWTWREKYSNQINHSYLRAPYKWKFYCALLKVLSIILIIILQKFEINVFLKNSVKRHSAIMPNQFGSTRIFKTLFIIHTEVWHDIVCHFETVGKQLLQRNIIEEAS